MDVPEAIAARRSVRGFLDCPVDLDIVRRLAIDASRAASGGNLQPWHVDIVAGAAIARLKAIMAEILAAGTIEPAEYEIYPRELAGAYRDRRFEVGRALYACMGIERGDSAGRRRAFADNFNFFGAPAALFVTVDRRMGPPQWSDLGQYLASFALLAVDAGLATCAQECWAMYPATVRMFLGTPENRMLFCGMAIGYEDRDTPANGLRSTRADEGEWLSIRAG